MKLNIFKWFTYRLLQKGTDSSLAKIRSWS